MIRFIFLFIVCFPVFVGIKAQESGISIFKRESFKQEVEEYEKHVYKQIKKRRGLKEKKGLRLIHIHQLVYYKQWKKEDFLNGDFLKQIHWEGPSPKKRLFKRKIFYVTPFTMIGDSLNNVYGATSGNYIHFFRPPKLSSDVYLYSLLNEGKADYIFRLQPLGIYYILKGDEIFVYDGKETYTMEDFVRLFWDKHEAHYRRLYEYEKIFDSTNSN